MFRGRMIPSVVVFTGILSWSFAAQGQVVIEWVTVLDPGNVDDTHGVDYGGVDYVYDIGKYEVTNAQYCEFLNAVAVDDLNGLYNTDMGGGWNDVGGITRSGSPGSYTYSVRPDRSNRPVIYVSWYDALRFANWMHNDQPAGGQEASTTEDGAYNMSLGSSVVRKPGARVFLPSEDEWYKAAYYKGGGTNAGYWDYPTQSDTAPTSEPPAGNDLVNGSANYSDADPTYYLTEVGAYTYKPSDSMYGTFDQGGNVWEWNEAEIPGDGSPRGMRGGSFDDPGLGMHANSRYAYAIPTHEYFNIGFRVAGLDIPTVTVGNPGNAGEWSGESYGGYGPDRICGSVGYIYSIAKFEVTAGQYTEFLNAVAATDTYGLYNSDMDSDAYGCQITQHGDSGSYTYDFSGRPSETEADDWVDRPVDYVSWGDAARFCNWLHNGQPAGAQDLTTTEDGSYYLNGATTDEQLNAVKREADATWVIPSEDEWYKAAYHKNDGVTGDYFDYPTSSDSVPSNDLIDPDPGNSANFYDNGYTIGSPYYRTVVGDFENSESPYDTFDQGGNVWEWTEAVIDGSYRGLRGGSFDYYIHDVLHAACSGYDGSPAYQDRGFGFRVVLRVDCNGNGIPDECDLTCVSPCTVYPGCGQSSDANADGIPDECGACCHSGGCDQVIVATCDSYGKYQGDTTTCEEECPSGIPTVSEWGLVVMTLLVLAAGTVVLARRRAVAVR